MKTISYFALCLVMSAAFGQSPVVGVDLRQSRYFTSTADANFVTNFVVTGPTLGLPLFAIDYDASATTLWAVNNTTMQYGTLNVLTATFTPLGIIGGIFGATGLTASANGTTWYLSESTVFGSDTDLFVGDITTGTFALVGTMMGAGSVIDISMSSTGRLIAHSISTDSFYDVDPTTAVATLIGPHGLAANFAQGMDFDWCTDTLYATIYTGGGTGQFCTVNLTTGAVTSLVATLPLNAEMEIAIRYPAPDVRFNPASGSYYLVVNCPMDWAAAHAEALASTWQGRAGHLATFENQAEQDWVLQNLAFNATTTCWIGLSQNSASPSYSEPTGGWEWATGERVNYLNWSTGEPNNAFGGEGFAEMIGNGTWNDRNNMAPFPGQYLVEYSDVAYNPASGSFYRLVPAGGTWSTANDVALGSTWAGRPGHLATFTSVPELSWILQNFTIDQAFIGLFQDTAAPSYSEPAGGWRWVNGESVGFTNWDANEPNNSGVGGVPEHFGMMYGSGTWNDVAASDVRPQLMIEFSNDGLGWDYCKPAVANSTGSGAEIRALGSVLVSANNLRLEAWRLPLNSLGFFLASRTQGYVFPVSNSQGALCIVGSIGRGVGGVITNAGLSGRVSVAANLQTMPSSIGPVSVLPGDSWNFQYWYRDAIGGSATSNFTHAVSVRFQ